MKKINCPFERKDIRGIFREISNNTPWKSINYGIMKKDSIMGNHYHKECKALFTLLQGSAEVKIKNVNDVNAKIETFILKESDSMLFDEYETHSIQFLEDNSFWLLIKSKEFDPKNPDLHEAKLI